MPALPGIRSSRNARIEGHSLRFAASALVLMAALSLVAFAQPTVVVTPKSGPPTDRAAVRGTGFAADEAVDIYFDTTDLALAATGRGGSFSGIRLTIPASATPGTHWITGVGRTSGLVAQTSFIVRTDWPQFLSGPQHHGYNSTENILSPSTVAGLQLLWSTPVSASGSSPVLANGIVYVTSEAHYLSAVEANTGRLLWTVPTGNSSNTFYPTPAVANDLVYSGSNDGLYAFDALTGQLIWKALPGSAVEAVTVTNGIVYVDSGDLDAFDAATGTLLWSGAANATFSPPAVANGVVYEGSVDGSVRAFNAVTGALIWESEHTQGSIFGGATVANGIVYVQSYQFFYAFNAANGQNVWSAPITLDISSTPTIADGVVYEGPFAFAAATGQPVWTAAFGEAISSAAVANGVVYLGQQNYNLYAYNAATGQTLWSAATGGPVASSPIVANGRVYVVGGDGYLYAFGLPPAQPPVQPDPAALKPDLTLVIRR